MEAPKRRFELTIHISGDTWDDVWHEALRMLAHVEEHGSCCTSVGGGPSSGHTVQVVENPEMTHEKYFEALDAYMAERGKAETP